MPFSKYSPKQKKLARIAEPRDAITGADFAALKKKPKKMNKGGMVEDLGSPKEVSFKSAGGRSTMRGMGAATRGGKFQGVF